MILAEHLIKNIRLEPNKTAVNKIAQKILQ